MWRLLPLVDRATNGSRAPSPAIGRCKVAAGRGYIVATHWDLAYTRRRKGNKRRCRFRVFDAFAHSRPSQRGGGRGPPPLVAIYSTVFFIVCTCSLSILENCQSWWSRFSKRTNYKIEREAWQPSRLPKYSLSSSFYFDFFAFLSIPSFYGLHQNGDSRTNSFGFKFFQQQGNGKRKYSLKFFGSEVLEDIFGGFSSHFIFFSLDSNWNL